MIRRFTLKTIFMTVLLMVSTVSVWSQDLKVRSFGVATGDLSASVNVRNDRNGVACGLIKVQLVGAGAKFEGSIIGDVSFQNNEYWVYMNQGAYLLNVSHPDFLPLDINLHDHGLKDGVQPKVTYKLVLTKSQSAETPKQKFIINYSPANAIVMVDSKTYQGNGRVELTLPVGSHDYQILAVGYEAAEGSIKLNANRPSTITVPLSPEMESTSQQQPAVGFSESQESPATSQLTADGRIETFTVNGVSFNMVRVEGGTFLMGSDKSDAESAEKPVHQVTLGSYFIGETEVTQELWEAVMGKNPSRFKGSNLPVENVSWDDCQEFIKHLNSKTGRTFRLPTEAEWEYAARGGNRGNGYEYSGSDDVGDVAWYGGNSKRMAHPVKTKQANELGLYDMSGNVWEWCQDWYGSYSSASQTIPTGSSSGSFRVIRGGSWEEYYRFCRSTRRNNYTPSLHRYYLGLRLAL